MQSRIPVLGVPGEGSEIGWSQSFSFVGTVLLSGFLLVYLRGILVPFVIAIFLAYLVRPLSERVSSLSCTTRDAQGLEETVGLLADELDDGEISVRIGELRAAADPREAMRRVQTALPRWVGVLLAMGLALGVMAGMLLAVFATFSQLEARLPMYRENAQQLWQRFIVAAREALDLDLGDLQSLPTRLISDLAGAIVSTSIATMTDVFLVVVFLAFLLLQPPAAHTSLRKKIDDSVSRYIILKSGISLGVSLVVYLTMTAIAFPLGQFIGLSTFVLSFVPNLGPLIAISLPALIVLLDPTVTRPAALVAVFVPLATHVCVGSLLEPLLFGRQFRMNPVVILFSLGVWYILWGTIGAVLAVPLTSILRIVCAYLLENNVGMPYIAVVSSVLEGRPLELAIPGQVVDPTIFGSPTQQGSAGFAAAREGRADSDAPKAR